MDAELYRSFWGLQAAFQNPTHTLEPSRWAGAVAALNRVLDAFGRTPIALGRSGGSAGAELGITVKYLSSPRLMGLQLADAPLRRQFLVQALIFLQACRVPGKSRSTGLKAKQARAGPSFLAQFVVRRRREAYAVEVQRCQGSQAGARLNQAHRWYARLCLLSRADGGGLVQSDAVAWQKRALGEHRGHGLSPASQAEDANALEPLIYFELARTPECGAEFAAAVRAAMQYENQCAPARRTRSAMMRVAAARNDSHASLPSLAVIGFTPTRPPRSDGLLTNAVPV